MSDDETSERERVRPEILVPSGDLARTGLPSDGEAGGDDETAEQVTQPTKLIRIASMVRSMLDEVRRAPLDDAGRRRLREIHEKSLSELESVLSPDLQAELAEVVLPLEQDTPTESELRLAQAQLVGWLEGLFHGIQAMLVAQQVQAQQHLQGMRAQLSERTGPPPGGPGYI